MGIASIFRRENILYYPGCLAKFLEQGKIAEDYKAIFNKLGIDFIMLPDEVCCGLPVLNGGYKKNARELAKKNFNLFKKNNIKKIITACPGCYSYFKNIYPELLRDWNVEVEHASVCVLKALRDKGVKFDGDKEVVSYHDPCHLGRYSDVYEEPRKVIEILGGMVIEMKHNREKALCCGGGGGVRANFNDLSKSIAQKRVKEVSKDAKKIISPCALCFANLKTADNRSEEFSSFVLRKLKEIK
jgi:Fe-S oxidoreductase